MFIICIFVYQIRQFQPTDIFPVIKLASQTLSERYKPSLFTYFYETFPQGIIVAEIGQKIIGFIIGIKINPQTAKILMLAVSEQYRHKKIGTALLKQLIQILTKEKIKKIELEVRTNNKEGIQFYKKHGFKINTTLTHFYQNDESAYSMDLEI